MCQSEKKQKGTKEAEMKKKKKERTGWSSKDLKKEFMYSRQDYIPGKGRACVQSMKII